MNDAAVWDLARRAGIALEWTDYADKRHQVSLDAVRRILAALRLPCNTDADMAHSRDALEMRRPPPLITTSAGETVNLPLGARGSAPASVRLILEDGTAVEVAARRTAHHLQLPAVDVPGYHSIEIGETRLMLAVAPTRCITSSDLAPGERVWGLAAQVYGLRSRGDCGIGDMAGVRALARSAAACEADALALSPVHAMFAADPNHFSPYSPSSRLFYNPLHADAASVVGEARVAKAADAAGARETDLESGTLIDWPASSRLKTLMLRCLFDDLSGAELAGDSASPLAADFNNFRAAGGRSLEQHALFDALHTARLRVDPQAWSWRDWPDEWRNPESAQVKRFAEENRAEIVFHTFLQWLADRSLAGAQEECRHAGMRIGLIADLAVGMNGAGSHAWTNQEDVLGGLDIGAPPDLYNTQGQSWGLTTFSPRALSEGAFAPFLATIRACMRHAGGVRIDHAMGLMRLWVVPHGAKASEGAYLAYPLDDLLRLTALESQRHRAIVIGEDLGTIPAGFRGRLGAAGVDGMRVLWFERQGARFMPPRAWSVEAAAMTSTHDLPTVAGWWSGNDIEARASCGLLKEADAERTARSKDRRALWRAFRAAKAGEGNVPAPGEGARAAAAAVKFVAQTRSRLALLPLEDALALTDQPNLPGTIDEHPNWRRRYAADAGKLLEPAAVRNRLHPLAARRLR